MNIRISNHAAQRALQRSKLFLRQHERDNIKWFLNKDFSEGHLDLKYVNVPFYRNWLHWKHGKDSFVVKSKMFEYRGVNLEDGTKLIKTVIFLKNRSDGKQ